jgi:hypothetical protein
MKRALRERISDPLVPNFAVIAADGAYERDDETIRIWDEQFEVTSNPVALEPFP